MILINLFFLLLFKISGWKFENLAPKSIKKAVVIGAPHTSNWDFIWAMGAFYIMKIPVKFTIKKEWFVWPLSWFFKNAGGLPIARNKAEHPNTSSTSQMVESIEKNDHIYIIVTPEGTRSKMEKWKTGFYRVALEAKVPILLGYIDYKNKKAGITETIVYPTGNMKEDFRKIMKYYKHANPKFPEKFSIDLDCYQED
jgi:1-acyl-sn-glycerol-3-phosphate acyltransferase